jgi:hypothetical protein
MVGADVAAEPNVLAGEKVPSGAVTGTAEMVPGIVHPPYSSPTGALKEKSRDTHLARVGIHVYRSPTLTSSHGVIGEYFAY